MKRFILISISAFIVSVMLCACSSAPHRGADEYQTVAADMHRDTDKARRLSAQGLELMADDEFDAAEKTLKRALEADIMFGPAHNSLGMVYYHQQRYYLAAWEFEYACKLMPDRPEPRNNFGLVFEAVGKLDDAVDWYGQALRLAPDNPELIGNLARTKIHRGDKDEYTRDLLQQLILKDTRPEWLDWATGKQSLLGTPSQSNELP